MTTWLRYRAREYRKPTLQEMVREMDPNIQKNRELYRYHLTMAEMCQDDGDDLAEVEHARLARQYATLWHQALRDDEDAHQPTPITDAEQIDLRDVDGMMMTVVPRDTCAKLEQALATLTEQTRWKPMDTAPKDMDIIGLMDFGDRRVIRYGKASHGGMYGWCLNDQGTEDFHLCDPTAWIHFPRQPTR